MLTKYFVEKYSCDDKVKKCLKEKLKNINNSDLYILLSKYLQHYCVNNLEYNSDLYSDPSEIELSSNFKEIIEREKNNIDIDIEEILDLRNVKESKIKESKIKESKIKIDFRYKHIDYDPINFMEIKKQYFENYSKNAIRSKYQIDFTR